MTSQSDSGEGTDEPRANGAMGPSASSRARWSGDEVLRRVDLRQLEIVKIVADSGSFTAAARQLHVSQSAISRQILMLEEELKEPLFVRLGRKVRLTPAGESLAAARPARAR